MQTKNYKTLRGLLSQTGQMNIQSFFSGIFYHKTKGRCNFTLSDDEKRKAAVKFAEYILATKSRRKSLVEALINGRGNLNYFRCFYIDYSPKGCLYCSNSLSGEAFEYCKRMYIKSITH